MKKLYETFFHIDCWLNKIMNGLLLYFTMFYLLKVSSAAMTVCKKIRTDNELEYDQQTLIIIEKDDAKKEQKGNNETKSEKCEVGKKGEKGEVGQLNQTEINQLKHKIIGWLVLNLQV